MDSAPVTDDTRKQLRLAYTAENALREGLRDLLDATDCTDPEDVRQGCGTCPWCRALRLLETPQERRERIRAAELDRSRVIR